MIHLSQLESEAISILREAVATAHKPVMLEWHLLWLPVVTMYLDFSASMGTRDL